MNAEWDDKKVEDEVEADQIKNLLSPLLYSSKLYIELMSHAA